MKLLIFGASGATGTQLVEQALAGGHEVTAFVRNPDKLHLNDSRLSLVEGNVADAAKVQEAVAGHEAILSALGAHQVFRFDPLVVKGLSHIVHAMADQQVKRLIYLSTLGVQATRKDAGFMIRAIAPTLIRHEIKGHEQRERIIQASKLQWTIVRAPILTNGKRTNKYRVNTNLKSNHFATKLSRADVAHCMLAQLQEDSSLQKAISVMP